LHDWLSWQESLNPRTIDLGLERVQQVLQRLGFTSQFICPVITVAGTNGKGSAVAMLESIYRAAGYSVGSYTSPHLFVYNERIHLDGEPVTDAQLCNAFEKVDQARRDIALTYFEFGTLAALQLFAEHKPDVVILEVGLGGRLDAVNVIDADVALITGVDIDHTDWLGPDIETIAGEKAGIMRTERPVIFGSLRLPQSVQRKANELHAHLLVAGGDYIFQSVGSECWQLIGPDVRFADLPRPALRGDFQIQNAAAVIMAMMQLRASLPLSEQDIVKGLQQVALPGRFQYVQQQPAVIVDVAHNPQAARSLSEMLQQTQGSGKTLAVIAMLADKPVAEVIGIMAPVVDEWFSAGLDVPRGMAAETLAKAVKALGTDVKLCTSQTVTQACEQAMQHAGADDRIIVFGSFYTVTEACNYFNRSIAGKG
ncbi:MAG: bifunctional tetrahydrofolate synthase/dihydrofolate synthase, partial [Gammaproteobacteria bacterium]